MKKKEIKLYKWNIHSNACLEDVMSSTAGEIALKLERGEVLTRDNWLWLTSRVNTSAFAPRGCVSVLGWCFDFRSVLRLYVYKQHGVWEEMYAPNKSILRKSVVGGSQLRHILEVK